MSSNPQKVALISVYEKKEPDIAEFAQVLIKLGWKIISSGGTARYLTERGIEVQDVAELVGGAAILGQSAQVTLSRELHAGLLARDCPEDIGELAELGISRIDLVCCDFYPLAKAIAVEGATVESVIEQTDIGGPTMGRSAAKGGRISICDPADRQVVLEQLQSLGDVCEETIQYLRAKTEFVVASYCLDSARFHGEGDFDGLLGHKVLQLAYGENRDQSPADLFSTGSFDPLAWDKFQVISGVPGYINMADGDRTLQIMCLLAEACRVNFTGKVPYIVIACKHGNPCGLGVDWDDPITAVTKAMLGDPIAVMGSEIMTNFVITPEAGEEIFRVHSLLKGKVGRKFWGADVVFAPGFCDEAVELLGKRERRRLLVNEALLEPVMAVEEWAIKPVRGGFIRQKALNFVFDEKQVEWLSKGERSAEFLMNLLIAWSVAWRTDSNTVTMANNSSLIGSGVGQQDRIFCVQLCVDRARRSKHNIDGAVFASDAFFPFAERSNRNKPRERGELLADVGCIGGVVPADGKNLGEVKSFFLGRKMQVAFVPKEHRGFSQH